ncbi:hypothetical protein PXH78_33515, partial [Mycolicibacterium smegmatis]|nr:hypothetical protein [Mycolicibacterium smegmatis]
LEAAKRDAQAQVTLAAASAEAIRRVAEAAAANDIAIRYLLGEKYVTALATLAESQSAKTVVLPGDLQEAVRGLFGRQGR